MPASSLWLLPRSPGHPAWWAWRLITMLVASAASSRAERTIPAGWLRNGKACLSMCSCYYAVCCPWGGGGRGCFGAMASIRGISNVIFAYLPFGHNRTKTSSHGKVWPAQCGSGVQCTVCLSYHVSSCPRAADRFTVTQRMILWSQTKIANQ